MVIGWNGGLVKKRNQGFILEQTKWLMAPLLRWGILEKYVLRREKLEKEKFYYRGCV